MTRLGTSLLLNNTRLNTLMVIKSKLNQCNVTLNEEFSDGSLEHPFFHLAIFLKTKYNFLKRPMQSSLFPIHHCKDCLYFLTIRVVLTVKTIKRQALKFQLIRRACACNSLSTMFFIFSFRCSIVAL